MKRVRITVIKKEFYPELAQKYLTDGIAAGPCPILEVGEIFYYEGGAEMPRGLCPWAWVDIYRGVATLSAGGSNTPWHNREGMSVYCCTDGVRPVSFLLEAVEDVPEQ